MSREFSITIKGSKEKIIKTITTQLRDVYINEIIKPNQDKNIPTAININA